jgi:hypothetical protein
MRETRGAYRVFVGKTETKRPLVRYGSRWEGNTKTDLQEIEWVDMDWIDLARDRDRWWAVVNAAMNVRVPSNEGIFLTT